MRNNLAHEGKRERIVGKYGLHPANLIGNPLPYKTLPWRNFNKVKKKY